MPMININLKTVSLLCYKIVISVILLANIRSLGLQKRNQE